MDATEARRLLGEMFSRESENGTVTAGERSARMSALHLACDILKMAADLGQLCTEGRYVDRMIREARKPEGSAVGKLIDALRDVQIDAGQLSPYVRDFGPGARADLRTALTDASNAIGTLAHTLMQADR